MPTFRACCAHDHDCEEAECGPAWSLHEHVDISRVTCLNEAEAGSVRNCFRPWNQRTAEPAHPLHSNEDDPELLINVPFNGAVKAAGALMLSPTLPLHRPTCQVKALCIIGGGMDGTAAAELRAFVNRDDLDFGAVGVMQPVQRWDLQEEGQANLEYPTQAAKFSGVHMLTLHIPRNFGGDHTTVSFIGIKGEFSERRVGPVTAVYEARALPQDHKVKDDAVGMKELM